MLQCIAISPAGNVWKRRTLYRIKPDQFDSASGRVINHPNQALLNTQIADAFHEAEARMLTWQIQGKPIDPARVIAPDGPAVNLKPTFLAYGRDYVEKCRLKDQHHTAEKYSGHLNKLAEYLGTDSVGNQKDILMDDVTEEWLLHWSDWLKDNGSRSVNTLHRRMAFVKTLFFDARRRGNTEAEPLALLKFKEQRVRKVKLSVNEIRALEELPLDGQQNDARNTFLLQFYAYGSRISDALTWKKESIRRRDGMVVLNRTVLLHNFDYHGKPQQTNPVPAQVRQSLQN